jgi:hypothetical protein
MAFRWLFNRSSQKSTHRKRAAARKSPHNRVGHRCSLESLESRTLLSATMATMPRGPSGPPAIVGGMSPQGQGSQTGSKAPGGNTNQTSTAAATSFCVTLLPPGPTPGGSQQGGQQGGSQGQSGSQSGGQNQQQGAPQGGGQGQAGAQSGSQSQGNLQCPPGQGGQQGNGQVSGQGQQGGQKQQQSGPQNGSNQNGAGQSSQNSGQTAPLGQLPPVFAGSTVTVQVIALDSTGKPTTNYSGTATVTSSDPSITLPGSLTFTNGVATIQVTVGSAGTDTFTVTDSTTNSIVGKLTICVVAAPSGQQGSGQTGNGQQASSKRTN